MMIDFCPAKSRFQCFCQISTMVLCCYWLIGCSGGISGTGDGGPDIIIENASTDDTNIATDADAITTPTESGPDSSGSPSAFDHQVFPHRLSTQISSALISAANLQESFPDLAAIPVSQKISIQLNTVTRQNIQVQLDLANIEALLLDTLLQCDSADPCSTVPAAITTTTLATGDQSSYSNLSYSRETAGYFDQKLQYTNQNGTRVVLQWTANQQLVSIVVDSNTAVTYLLSDLRQSTTTMRTEDKSAAVVFQAVLAGSADTGMTIEADWHGDQQHYLRASADETQIILYAIHPTDPAVMRTREAFNLVSADYAVESCTADHNVCPDWQSLADNSSTIETQLRATEATLGDFSQSISSNLQITVAAQVNEWVIANNNGTDQPEALSLQCGGQRVLDSVRNFCWQPLPLTGSAQIYEEISGSGSLIYRHLPAAQIQ